MNSYEKWKQIEREINEVHERRDKNIEIKLNKCLNYENEFVYKFKDEDLPSKALQRKSTPVFSGVLSYFPDALKEVSKCSLAGNNQHHSDKPLHWDKNKSSDNADALTRHLIDHSVNPIDDDGILHLSKVAWRALALLQIYLDKQNDK